MRHAHWVLAAIAVLPLTADARPKRKAKGKANKTALAKAHTDKAAKAHKAGKFDVALAELQAAYEVDPQPKLLFGIGQVQAKLDNCADAVVSYEKFLAATKDTKKQAIVKQAIAACTEKLAAAAPPPAVEPSPPPVETTPPVVDPPQPPPPIEELPPPAIDESPPHVMPGATPVVVVRRDASPWYADWLGDALVVGGVAAGAVSVVTYLGARGALDDAEDAATLDEYDRLVDDARSKRTLSVIFAGGGAVLFGAGLLRYALRDSGEARSVAITPTSGGGLVTWTGGF